MPSPFDIDNLTDTSREFAREFLGRFPALASCCSTQSLEGIPGNHLAIQIDSPAGADRKVCIWMEGEHEPSLVFGADGWHTHNTHYRELGDGRYRNESLLDLLQAILTDEFVICEEPDAPPDRMSSVLDLRDPTALLDEVTSPGSSERIRIKSFTGRADRETSLADL